MLAERSAVVLARMLREAGLPAPIDAAITFARALDVIDPGRRESVYWAARATLVSRPDDIAAFDRSFADFWDRSGTAADGSPASPRSSETSAIAASRQAPAGGPVDTTHGPRGAAPMPDRRAGFASYDAHERSHAHELMRQLRDSGAPRRSPRRRPSARGSRPDLRATIRAALRTGGEPIHRPRRDITRRPRRVVLLLDVSRSMEPYSRGLLRFVHAAVAGRRHVEAFAMGTSLTHITRELVSRDPDRALARAGERVADWSGGTRLGSCLRRFNDEWGIRGMARGSMVVILSDGWERGDPAELADQVHRLHRVAHAVVWVNPVAGTPGYAPLARGLAASLAHVDRLVEGHSAAALDELVDLIDAMAPGSQRATEAATTGRAARARAAR